MRRFLESYSVTLFSLAVTFVLEIVANFVLHLDTPYQFVVIAVGLMASVVVASVERAVPEVFKSLLNERLSEITRGFELYRLLTNIDDRDLQGEVVKLARSLSSGEIPAFLAELRARKLIKLVA